MNNSIELIEMEKAVVELLQTYAKNRYSKYVIAPHVAAMSLKENHLYEDMGFKNRNQMGKYIKMVFPKTH